MRRGFVLPAILIAGAAVRVWGLSFGLPHTLAQADESLIARAAIDVARGTLNPGFFNYPSFFIYLAGGAFSAYCDARVLTGGFASTVACTDTWATAWEPFFLLARGLSVLAGTITIALVYRLGLRAFDWVAASSAAALLAVTFLHVRESHFGVTDTTMTALVVAAVLGLLRAHDEPSPRRFAVAGVLAGLAASTKYNGLLLVAPLIVSQLHAWLNRGARALDARTLVFGAAMAAGFAAGTPFALLDRHRFWADATGEAAHLLSGHGVVLGVGWLYHARVTLWHGVTWPILVASLAGVGWAVRRDVWRAALVLAFPAVYYVVAGRGLTVFARYMLPMTPFLCLMAGHAVSRLAAHAARRGLAAPAGAAIVTAALSVVSAQKVMALDRLLSRVDNRVLAAAWIDEHVPRGASIYVSGSRYGMPDLGARGRAMGWTSWTFDPGRRRLEGPAGPDPAGPDWIVVQESPLPLYSDVPGDVRSVVVDYERRAVLRAVNLEAWHVYDQQDAFFLPLAGFDGVGRPGPNFSIYQRRSESGR